jgi:glycerol kinase
LILAIDQGTTGTSCFVFDERRVVRGRAYREITQHFPAPGMVEHDANEIWDSVCACAEEALAAARIGGGNGLTAVGITNQRETAVAWNRRTAEPIRRAIVWQDRRTAARCRELQEQGWNDVVRERTGLVIDPYFSGTKYELLLGAAPGPEIAVGTVDAWLAFKLIGRHVTDASNAARTLLFDIHRQQWDGELCELLNVPVRALPEVVPSCGVIGHTARFGGRVPLTALLGDQQAALFGQCCLTPGSSKNTYGTGSFPLRNVGAEPPAPAEGLITTVAWLRNTGIQYALEASVFVAGAAVQWLRDGLGLIETAAETEALARSVDSCGGVVFVPALTGLGSPFWQPEVRGTISGLTRGTTRAHLARAALEAIALQTVDVVEALDAAAPERMTELQADGGATANRWLMQFQADVLGVPVVVPELIETTVVGAALMAGLGAGVWTDDDLPGVKRDRETFSPTMSRDECEAIVATWRHAVQRTRSWYDQHTQDARA